MTHNTNNLRLEVEVPTEGHQNLIQNPDGEKGGWGWVTPVNNTAVTGETGTGGVHYLRFNTTVAQSAYFTSEHMPVVAGKYVSAQFTLYSRTTGVSVRARYEWYNSSKTLLSSSTQSAAFSTTGTPHYVPGIAAPANTAFVKLRLDMYYNGSTPQANNYVGFRNAMVIAVDNAAGLGTVRKNLYQNPAFMSHATNNNHNWDWVISTNVSQLNWVEGGDATFAPYSTTWTNNHGFLWFMTGFAGSPSMIRTKDKAALAVQAGKRYVYKLRGSALSKWAGADASVNNGEQFQIQIEWYNDTKKLSTSSSPLQTLHELNDWKQFSVAGTAPSGAKWVILTIRVPHVDSRDEERDFMFTDLLFEQTDADNPSWFWGDSTDTATVNYTWDGTVNNSSSTRTTSGDEYPFEPPNDWTDILGPTSNISIRRDTLNVGTMGVVVHDAMLDPAVASWVRPGKKVRLHTLIGDVWESRFEGVLDNAHVTYPREKVAGSLVETRIELTASDAISHLANQGENRGVANIGDLPFILEGKGVPWNVNGSGDQVTSATVVSYNENASVVDQVAITRDTALGYAWVDRNNVLQVWDAAQLSSTPTYTFSDVASVDPNTVSYSDIDVDFNMDSAINDVTVNWLRYDIGSVTTTEVPYGPYQNADSVKTWGARSATYTIHGVTESSSSIAAYAQAILDANSVPQIRANSLTMPVRNEKERAIAAVLDLYMPVAVKYDTKVDKTLRITGIEEEITPDTWDVTLTFDVQGSVATPTWTPSPAFTGISETPAAKLSNSSAQSIANQTFTEVVFTTKEFNQGDIVPSTVANSITINTSGIYRISYGVRWDGNGTGRRQTDIYLNGGYLYSGQADIVQGASAGRQTNNYTEEKSLVAGDVIELHVWQNSGGALTTNSAWLSVIRVA